MPDNDHDSIEEIMYYVDNSGENNIIQELRVLGYDVVIVNHPTYMRGNVEIDGGADFIQRNAMAHVKLYQDINTELIANNSNE